MGRFSRLALIDRFPISSFDRLLTSLGMLDTALPKEGRLLCCRTLDCSASSLSKEVFASSLCNAPTPSFSRRAASPYAHPFVVCNIQKMVIVRSKNYNCIFPNNVRICQRKDDTTPDVRMRRHNNSPVKLLGHTPTHCRRPSRRGIDLSCSCCHNHHHHQTFPSRLPSRGYCHHVMTATGCPMTQLTMLKCGHCCYH